MKKPSILYADVDIDRCHLMGKAISAAGYSFFVAHNQISCMLALQELIIDIVFLDLDFPKENDGLSTLSQIKISFPKITVIVLSGFNYLQEAVVAIQNGAFDYIVKPFGFDACLAKIRIFEDQSYLQEVNTEFAYQAIGMVGKSQNMRHVFDSIIQASKFDVPVLVIGETGVGKELVAKAIHRLSRFAHSPLVSVNCAAIPSDLMESELFGYTKGAFTGAEKPKKGYFEHADGGSIFLNEISELPYSVQSKLLRVIAEGEIQKVGGTLTTIKTRIISDTNRNLSELIDNGLFRKDLYYRVSSVIIQVPPLRERIEDLPALANHFLSNFCALNNLIPKTLSPQALQWLMQQEWHGNVRELKNTIESVVINTSNDLIGVADLHPMQTKGTNEQYMIPKSSIREALHQFEKDFIINVLKANNWNVTRSAKIMDIDKSNLIKKIRSYKIMRDSCK